MVELAATDGADMSADLETLALAYWQSSLSLRDQLGGLSLSTARAYVLSQSKWPGHPVIEQRCRQATADLGLADVECLRPCDSEPA